MYTSSLSGRHRRWRGNCREGRESRNKRHQLNYRCLLSQNLAHDSESLAEDTPGHPRGIQTKSCHHIGTASLKPKQFWQGRDQMLPVSLTVKPIMKNTNNICLFQLVRLNAYITSRTLVAFICCKNWTNQLFRCCFLLESDSCVCLGSMLQQAG